MTAVQKMKKMLKEGRLTSKKSDEETSKKTFRSSHTVKSSKKVSRWHVAAESLSKFIRVSLTPPSERQQFIE